MKNKIIKYCDYVIEFSLYFLIFFLPFSKAGIQIFCWLAILFWFLKKIASLQMPIKSPLPFTKLNKPLLAFIIMCVLSTMASVDFDLSLKALFTKVIKNVILFFMVAETINNKRRLRNLITVFVLSGILIVIDAGVQYFRGADFLRGYIGGTNNLKASFSNNNSFGGWLIVMIPIIFGILLSRQFILGIIKKIIIGGLFVLLLICLVATYSRGSWVGFTVSLGLIACYSFSLLNRLFKVLTIVYAVLFLSIVFFTMPQTMKERLSKILPQTIRERIVSIISIENSSLFRINLWRESLEIIQDFPIFGTGLNTYSKVGPIYAKAGGGYYPHNSYLHMAAEIGVLGLFSFLWIIAEIFKLGMNVFKKTRDALLLGLLASISTFLTQSFFDVNFYALQLATLFWFVLGLTMAKIRMLS